MESKQIIRGGDYGQGVHKKRPALTGDHCEIPGMGVHANQHLHIQRHHLGADRPVLGDKNRPQLADAYSRGRGVHGNDASGTCEQRRLWLLDWFSRLRDRLRTVRVCCGDFMRVIGSPSVTTRLGTVGIFFDAPYRKVLESGKRNRDSTLYSTDRDTECAVDRVIAYCLERGNDPKMRIAACCYEGEGYEILLEKGWKVESWKSPGGYGNRTEYGKDNTRRERIFFSPHCLFEDVGFGEIFT